VAEQGGQADASAPRDVAHRHLGSSLGHQVTRDRQHMVVILLSVGSHRWFDKWISDPYIRITDPQDTTDQEN
jgi:hypothetical protein